MIHGQINGAELKKWIRFHADNQTEHTSVAMKMRRYLNVGDKVQYIVTPRNRVAEDGFLEVICPEIRTVKS